jgi:mRNA-degrading endonuclease toxin of MazEF toxin-antitoxin module
VSVVGGVGLAECQSWIMCDNLTSLRRSDLSEYVGTLPPARIVELNSALRSALDLM